MKLLTLLLYLMALVLVTTTALSTTTTTATTLSTYTTTLPSSTLSPIFNATIPLPIPVPNTPTYPSDLAAVLSTARNARVALPSLADKRCGEFIDMDNFAPFITWSSSPPLYTCRDTAPQQKMASFANWYCGFCMVFDGYACQGDVRWSGGPTTGWNDMHDVKGARSYFCF